jgi:primosomal protein N' (replication factor Y)
VRVALDVPVDSCFDYLAEVDRGDIGRRVLVPFGKRKLVGVILGLAQESGVATDKLKAAVRVYRDTQPLDDHILAVFAFCRDYYHHPIGEVVVNALPPGLRRAKAVLGRGMEVVRLTDAGRALDVTTWPARAVVKRRLMVALQAGGSMPRDAIRALSRRAPCLLRELADAGLIRVERMLAAVTNDISDPPSPPTLNSDQQAAFDAIASGLSRFVVTLLYGVTGSGKTEVYLHLTAETLARGRQALILVPEINLTPQLEATFRARFPGIAQISLHSKLSEGERAQSYLAAQSGVARIVLGTRLAVFTPLPQLGLIVVDEEQDASFKQHEGLRYSARDVAIYRAKLLAIPVVLGSATPSLESYHNARAGRYQLAQIRSRAVPDAALPEVRIVATTGNMPEGVSPPVLQALRERLERGEQSLVFINRRGYAPVLLCGQCGWISGCPRCSARLTLHAPRHRLRCHYCGLETAAPAACPECGNADLRPVGQGTQRIEARLIREFPTASILRVDRDTASSKASLQSFIDRVHGNDVNILVGTQILAKGHDFPGLTLVAVINADASLYSSDFRAEERLFAQLMQVAGRAGRAGLRGEVLVQTAFPRHPLFAALKNHEFAAFADAQLQLRREHHFPPYTYQVLLRAESLKQEAALEFTQRASALAKPLAKNVRVFDPVPAQPARIAARERWQLLLQSASRSHLQLLLNTWRPQLATLAARDVRWAIDVDPLEL